jgi:phosphoribosyl 1,2-cyclic phosphodiesterase
MEVVFWGVRGSIPMSGVEVHRYGGHTSCVSVGAPNTPALVFDCGTGARALGRKLMARGTTDVFVLFSHTHMDHLFALPYFEPMLSPGCRITLCVPALSRVEARTKIDRYLNGIYHPLRTEDFAAELSYAGVVPGSAFELGPYSIRTVRLVHPGGTIGYRVTLGDQAVCYLTDTGPLAAPDEGVIAGESPTDREAELIDLVAGADLMIMDTTFTQAEYLERITWGHGYPEYAVRVAETAGVKTVALFHHDPDATDAHLDAIGERWSNHAAPRVFVAKEGMVVDLSG